MLQYNVLYIKHITGERGSMLNFIRGFCMALADSVPVYLVERLRSYLVL